MKYVLTLGLLGIMAVATSGCSNDMTAASVRGDMHKDLVTPGETAGEVENRMAFTSTVNTNNFNQDLLRFMLLDRPSRSIQYPTIGE